MLAAYPFNPISLRYQIESCPRFPPHITRWPLVLPSDPLPSLPTTPVPWMSIWTMRHTLHQHLQATLRVCRHPHHVADLLGLRHLTVWRRYLCRGGTVVWRCVHDSNLRTMLNSSISIMITRPRFATTCLPVAMVTLYLAKIGRDSSMRCGSG